MCRRQIPLKNWFLLSKQLQFFVMMYTYLICFYALREFHHYFISIHGISNIYLLKKRVELKRTSETIIWFMKFCVV